MIVKPVNENQFSIWDEFVDNSFNGVFLNKQRFLSYHDNRFKDASIIIENDKNNIIGLFPAAVAPNDSSCIISHPGATYGGLIASKKCRGETCIQTIENICSYYSEHGYRRLVYKTIPYIYHRQPYQDDVYALFRLGANKYRCDISATINLAARGQVTKGRKYEINKGKKNGITINSDIKYAENIWKIIEMGLLEKYQLKPVHSLKEILLLQSLFQKEITFLSAIIDDEIVAGLVLFGMGNVLHTQYISAGNKAYECGALDFLIEEAINKAKDEGFKYFDFGISNEDEGRILNEGLYRYKRTFGAGSIVHEFYELDLTDY